MLDWNKAGIMGWKRGKERRAAKWKMELGSTRRRFPGWIYRLMAIKVVAVYPVF